MNTPFVVVSDLDGTITEDDMLARLVRWVDPASHSVISQIQHQDIPLKDGMAQLIRYLNPDDLPLYHQYLHDTTTIRSGFEDTLVWCHQMQIPFMVATNGFDAIVQRFLQPWIPEDDIFSLNTDLTGGSNSLATLPPCAPSCMGGCGLCKTAVVLDLRARYQCPVVFIGDGITDWPGSHHADVVIARGTLASLRQTGYLPTLAFDSFHDVRHHLEQILRKGPLAYAF